MKKTICFVTICILLASVLMGCTAKPLGPGNTVADTTQQNDPNSPDHPNNNSQSPSQDKVELDAESAIRLLLAEERLNASLLQNDGDIFEQGAKAMQNLAAMTEQAIQSGSAQASRYLSGNLTTLAEQSDEQVVYEGKLGGGRVTYDGQSYLFSDFRERSNSYEAYSSTSQAIAENANNAAKIIDFFKENIRIVDKWVKMPNDGQLYYLHVGQNEEVLYNKNSYQTTMCRRYRNEEGLNVYEYFLYNEKYLMRMVYIPGVHLEFHDHFYSTEDGMENYFIADATKGYWECYRVGVFSTHYNVSYMVMKDDICYDSFYDPETGLINYLKVISADKKTDIFSYSAPAEQEVVYTEIQLSGFDGVKGIRVDEIEYVEMGGDVGAVPCAIGQNHALVMESGLEIREGDTFVNGRVTGMMVRSTFSYPAHTGSIEIRVEAATLEERLALIQAFCDEVGLVCRRDADTVMGGVQRAFDELTQLTKYHAWNGYAQATSQGIANAIAVDNAYTQTFIDAIAAVADAEIVDYADMQQVAHNAHFATVTPTGGTATTYLAGEISIDSLTLTLSDTLLLLAEQNYTLGFALAGEDGLILLATETELPYTAFDGGDTFSVSVQNVTLKAPALEPGSYTFVAFLKTDDGYRCSAYTPVAFTQVDTESELDMLHSKLTAANRDGALVLQYAANLDVYLIGEFTESFTYTYLYEQLASYACTYGIPSEAEIEMLTDAETQAYTALTGQEQELGAGTYRLLYSIENGEQQISGYVYLTMHPGAGQERPDTEQTQAEPNAPEQ